MAGKESEKAEKKDKKKKKGKGGLLLLLLLLILVLLGLGLHFGFGGLGGLLPGGIGMQPAAQQSQQPAPEEATPTPETEVPNKGGVQEVGTAHVIVVGEEGITFDGAATTAEELRETVSGLDDGAEVVLKDAHAVVEDYSTVKMILDEGNIAYTEEK